MFFNVMDINQIYNIYLVYTKSNFNDFSLMLLFSKCLTYVFGIASFGLLLFSFVMLVGVIIRFKPILAFYKDKKDLFKSTFCIVFTTMALFSISHCSHLVSEKIKHNMQKHNEKELHKLSAKLNETQRLLLNSELHFYFLSTSEKYEKEYAKVTKAELKQRTDKIYYNHKELKQFFHDHHIELRLRKYELSQKHLFTKMEKWRMHYEWDLGSH